MCLANGLPERKDALREPIPARPERQRIQPLTWIFTVALMPVLLYDVWQTVKDVKQHRVTRACIAVNLSPPAARPHGFSD